MTIRLNGEPRDVPDGCTVSALLAELKLNTKALAVERNLELVPRRDHETAVLVEGDRVEIVTLVGGG